MSDNNKDYYHNKGQEDAAESKSYSPPHGLIDSLITWSRDEMDRHQEENEAYRQGWDNGKKQND